MPLTVVANQGTAPTPQIVTPQVLVQKVQQGGGGANAALALAFTFPIISIDQRQLQYKQRMGASGAEFSFDTGTLTLNLRQEMFISNALSACARGKWQAHEDDHVQDNQNVMPQMDGAIRADPVLRNVFVTPQWFPTSTFAAKQQEIHQLVGDIFRRLTSAAATARDTRAEYMRVHRDVLQNCPGPYIYEVNRGDTLSRIAEFFYGRASAWPAIQRANAQIKNPNLIVVGWKLVIPRTP